MDLALPSTTRWPRSEQKVTESKIVAVFRIGPRWPVARISIAWQLRYATCMHDLIIPHSLRVLLSKLTPEVSVNERSYTLHCTVVGSNVV